jgi:putative YhbY family RNA-binding protein
LALTSAERRNLRARAQRLHPVVSIGQQGLTPSVLHEIDVNLLAHELIKVRVFNADRDAREAVLTRICAELDAAPVQHIGKLLVVWRPAPTPEPQPKRAKKAPGQLLPRPAVTSRARRRAPPRGAPAPALTAGQSRPQARRPREPAPRTPARPPSLPGRTRHAPPVAGRRRRGGRTP